MFSLMNLKGDEMRNEKGINNLTKLSNTSHKFEDQKQIEHI